MQTSSKATLIFALLTAAGGLMGTPSAHAQVTGFVNSPTTNSTDFKTAVAAKGDTVDSSVNFDAEAAGAVNPIFNTVSDGLTITSSGITTSIQNGAGPGQGNTTSGPVSPGEGVHPASNFLFVGGTGSLTLSFAAPVAGVGFSTIDLFNSLGANPISITAYSGTAGTGTTLGTFSAVGDNFQNNKLYFLGAADSTGANTIGSLVLAYPNPGTGADQIGIDNILIARASAPVPEASTTVSFGLLLVLGLGAMGIAARKRRRA